MIATEILGLEPFGKMGRFFFEKRTPRIVVLIIFAVFFFCSLGIVIYANKFLNDQQKKDYVINFVLPFFVAPCAIIGLLFFSYILSQSTSLIESQLLKLQEERVEITQKIEQEKEIDIFHTIQLSLNQLNEYYTINKGQARSSFRFSLFAIVLGLLTISIGVWLHYLGNSNTELSFISGISGVLLEFIGGAYFFMYKKSLEQLNFFFGQLIKIQDTMLAINLSDSIADVKKKSDMHEKIISSLLKRSLK